MKSINIDVFKESGEDFSMGVCPLMSNTLFDVRACLMIAGCIGPSCAIWDKKSECCSLCNNYQKVKT